jgi:hypothetical protein
MGSRAPSRRRRRRLRLNSHKSRNLTVRYRFRGLIRETGRVVEGHVESNVPDDALAALSENGIVAESLREDPKPLNLTNRPQSAYSDALDSALDTSAAQVPFDALEARFKGKQVWVLDRDKIRRRVAEVVDQVLSQSMMAAPGDASQAETTRAAVSDAINNLFRDNRNITSRASEANSNLDRQISRLATFISKAEDVLARISSAARGGFGGGGGWAPRRSRTIGGGQEQNKVLKEIFESNIQLLRILEGHPAASDEEVAAAASSEPGAEPSGEPEMATSGAGRPESPMSE